MRRLMWQRTTEFGTSELKTGILFSRGFTQHPSLQRTATAVRMTERCVKSLSTRAPDSGCSLLRGRRERANHSGGQ